MTRMIATFLYIGYLRPAPGTWGSLAALPVAWAILVLAGPWALLLATLACYGVGQWAVAAEIRGKADHDPSEIVVDEVCGQWIALLPLGFGAAQAGVSVSALWPGWLAAFVLFRLFDIVKWGPVGWADRKGGAVGVMLDDVIAGIMAALGVILLAGLAHA